MKIISFQLGNSETVSLTWRGGTQYKRPYRDVPQTWVSNQPLGILMTPYEYETQNLVCEWVDFSKFSQIWLKFKKILEKSGNFGQNLVQIQADWYINDLL